jgi:glycine betaine/proline transport system substrate-binding protein
MIKLRQVDLQWWLVLRKQSDKEWIVVTGWKPHFKWAQHDLKYLKDPKGVYPKACSIISRRGFQEDQPEAATFSKTLILKKNSCMR